MAAQVQRTALAAAAYTTVFTAAADCTVNIRLTNRDPLNAITISLAVGAASAPAAPALSDYVEQPSLQIPAGGVLEELGMSMAAGEVVTAFSSAATCSVRVYGR